MRQRILAFVTPLCIAAATAAPAPAAPTTVDPCLVGTWTLTRSAGAGQGAFVGVKMTVSAGGVATLDYTHARPFKDGGMNTSFRGHSTIDIATSPGKPPAISVRSEHVSLTETNALVGTARYRAHDPVWEYSEDYTCSAHKLTMRSGGTGGGLLNGIAIFSR